MKENDEKDDEIIEESPMEEESFAELLRESFVDPVRLNPGRKLKARIVKISPEWIFIDLGGKSEGYLDIKEFFDEEGKLSVREGDLIEAYFISSDDTGQRFASKISGGQAGQYYLDDAHRSGIPVEGLVEKEVKGGFEVRMTGGFRGFCPYSQMGLKREANPAAIVGSHLTFRITQYDDRGRNIVLSSRAVQEEELQKQKEEQKDSLREGARIRGTIASIHSFGAFVRVGAVEGLIPISEIAWDRVDDITKLLTVGQEVEVMVMKLDWEKDRLSFSLKRALPDPWESIEKDFPQGSVHSGTVVRLANFGAFVSLAPGVDGLLHISRMGSGKRIKHPHEVVAKDQIVEVKIDNIDTENKRISLSLPGTESDAEKEAGADYSQYLKASASMGTMADLLRAKLKEKSKK
jgi:small subunit ribosomal protein S1